MTRDILGFGGAKQFEGDCAMKTLRRILAIVLTIYLILGPNAGRAYAAVDAPEHKLYRRRLDYIYRDTGGDYWDTDGWEAFFRVSDTFHHTARPLKAKPVQLGDGEPDWSDAPEYVLYTGAHVIDARAPKAEKTSVRFGLTDSAVVVHFEVGDDPALGIYDIDAFTLAHPHARYEGPYFFDSRLSYQDAIRHSAARAEEGDSNSRQRLAGRLVKSYRAIETFAALAGDKELLGLGAITQVGGRNNAVTGEIDLLSPLSIKQYQFVKRILQGQ